jgi:vitamin K-dependent gamma-carboxylase-like protein
VSRAVAAWERFWFEPESTSVVALWRIAFGLIACFWAIALAPDLFTFFSSSGIQSVPPIQPWSLLHVFPGDGGVLTLYVLLLVGSVCLTIGLLTRAASIVVWVCIVSFTRRMPFILNSGDVALQDVAFYVMLAPAGAALSVDRWLSAKERFWDAPLRAPWALRLMQVQLSVLYLAAVWAKLQGKAWNDGTAVHYAFSAADLHRFPLPDALVNNALVVNLETYGTLAIEASLGILVWKRVLRPWVLLAGVFLHLSIDYAVAVSFFSWTMLASYLAWVSPQWLDAKLLALRSRLVGRPAFVSPASLSDG